MRHVALAAVALVVVIACGGAKPAGTPAPAAAIESSAPVAASAGGDAGEPKSNEFLLRTSESGTPPADAHPSSIKATKNEAALKLTVVDKQTGPIQGVVISLTAPDGKKYYTGETDAQGYAEVLVPVGAKYQLVYLSLGRDDVAASVTVTNEPNQNLRLTLRYNRKAPPVAAAATPDGPTGPRVILDGVEFDTGKTTIRAESLPRFDDVVEYLTHKQSARIEIAGHSDNVGNPKFNKTLSAKRAEACRDYLISKGIDGSRIQAVGYGDELPIESNATEAGRQKNRRIEATEL